MLTSKQNLMETIRGGKPDRYVNQFEAFKLQWCNPQNFRFPDPEYGKERTKNCWGVTFEWPKGTPGAFPVQSKEYLVIKDITRWKEFIKMPETNFPEEEWKWIMEETDKVDRNEYFVTATAWPGLFEICHDLMSMEECMINLYEEPECMHELIDFLMEYKLKMAEQICKHIHPDALYSHDDWGSQKSTFMSKEMFREFYLEPTKKIYKYYKDHGVEVVIHHSDSYCETFVPEMIEMGIDIWQGALSTNDIPKIAKEYGEKITIMGGINNGIVDCPDWSKEKVTAEVDRVCEWAGTKYFIPNCTLGADMSTFEGVYDCVTKEIDNLSKKYFK